MESKIMIYPGINLVGIHNELVAGKKLIDDLLENNICSNHMIVPISQVDIARISDGSAMHVVKLSFNIPHADCALQRIDLVGIPFAIYGFYISQDVTMAEVENLEKMLFKTASSNINLIGCPFLDTNKNGKKVQLVLLKPNKVYRQHVSVIDINIPIWRRIKNSMLSFFDDVSSVFRIR